MDIKLLAVDIDETMVNSHHKMTTVTQQALKKAMEQGITVAVVTGRCLEGLPAKLRTLEGIRYVISSNGAKIYDMKAKKVLYRKLISTKSVLDIWNVCKNFHVGLAFHSEGRCYDNRVLQMLYRRVAYHRDFKTHSPIINLEKWVKNNKKPLEKLQIFSGNREKLQTMNEQLRELPGLKIAYSSSNYIEITDEEANKGKALNYLCHSLGIPLEQVMAIGDNANDCSMLKIVGCPVAMGNANEEVKRIAKIITSSHDDNGVAKVINEYLL